VGRESGREALHCGRRRRWPRWGGATTELSSSSSLHPRRPTSKAPVERWTKWPSGAPKSSLSEGRMDAGWVRARLLVRALRLHPSRTSVGSSTANTQGFATSLLPLRRKIVLQEAKPPACLFNLVVVWVRPNPPVAFRRGSVVQRSPSPLLIIDIRSQTA
jgi:hypothetical protein